MDTSADEGTSSEQGRPVDTQSFDEAGLIELVGLLVFVSGLVMLLVGCGLRIWGPIRGYQHSFVATAAIAVLIALCGAIVIVLAHGINAGRQRSAKAFLLMNWLVFVGVLAHVAATRHGLGDVVPAALMVIWGHRVWAKMRRRPAEAL